MKIYVAHASAFDFQGEFYAPLKSALGDLHQLILPHAESQTPYPSQQLFNSRGCDIVLAEVSYPSIGLGIELGWASAMSIPVYALHLTTAKISSSLSVVAQRIVSYQDATDLMRVSKSLIDDIGKTMNEPFAG